MKLKGTKKKKKNNILAIIIFLIIIVLISSIFLLKYLSTKVTPFFLSYAESETRKLTTLIINKAVTKQIASDMEIDEIFDIVKNDNGEIILISFNSKNVTKILNSITNLVQLNLKSIEEGNVDLLELPDNSLKGYNKELLKQGIIYEIPIGAVTNSAFLANLGPKIPVKLRLIGDVVSGVNTKVSEYGINNAYLEVSVEVTVTTRINLPFISREIEVKNNIPIAMKVIQGKIPNFYLDNIKGSSNIVENPT